MERRIAPQSTIIGEETPCLPEQLITEEILTRLPVKSLLKFRCVSKSWCSLIGSKRFIKAHLKNSIQSSSFASHRWVFYASAETCMMQCSLSSLFDNPFTDPVACNTDLGIDLKRDDVSPVGYCNGLVCILVNWRRFILWNPTTKKFKYLPYLYNQLQVEHGCILKYGFGFDELSDDYKVFSIVSTVNLEGPPPHCVGMIYSLRSNSWKHIEETDHFSPLYGVCMYLSGKFHWYRKGSPHYKCDIVSFDLNGHVYGLVELPSYAEGNLHNIRMIGGCLSVHFHHLNGDLDVWVMKEYGVKNSWKKVVTIPCYESPREILDPIAIAPNGEVLIIYKATIVIYNPKSGVFWHPQITGLGDKFNTNEFGDEFNPIDSLGIYIESLVSVDPDAQ